MSKQMTVTVTVDLTNYPTTAPTISCSPVTAEMVPGDDTLTWNLTVTNNTGSYVVAFAPTNGIAFETNFPGTVSYVNTTQFTATDPNTTKADYSYTVNITVNSAPFSLDPDVENDASLLRMRRISTR